MKLQRTVKLKLGISVETILPTIIKYTKAFNYVCDIGWESEDFNSVSLHNKTYKEVRKSLPSQLSCSSRMKASEALKGAIQKKKKNQKVTKPQSKICSIRYDACSFNVWFDRNLCSISTISGRLKCTFHVANCFKQYLNWRRNSAELFIKKGKVFLNIVFSKEVEDIVPDSNPIIIGIDRGINKLAVCSNNKFFSGSEAKRVSRKYRRIRSKLQSRGTKSARRHLKKLALKENRFKTHLNHKISKEIINLVPEGSILVLENLKHIRKQIRTNKTGRRNLSSWAFCQLEQFLTYKSEAKRVLIDFVPAYYTSQKCSICGYVDRKNRKYTSLFVCKKCGLNLDADLNAARNVELNYRNAKGYSGGLSVNQPIVPALAS